jgi:hypothetical protein
MSSKKLVEKSGKTVEKEDWKRRLRKKVGEIEVHAGPNKLMGQTQRKIRLS